MPAKRKMATRKKTTKKDVKKKGSYAEFVKANYSKVKEKPANQRFAALAQMWKAKKG